jgi:hypothetical protein
MAGVFAAAQQTYAALKIAVFPFDATEEVKRGPMVSHYSRMGLQASSQMALRFPDAPGVAAMAGKRNRFTIIDIDERGAAGERLLADVQSQFGRPKVVVMTGSGGLHCYYRHAGERRQIRPVRGKPIDVIGDGPIVLPPSRGFRGNYQFIQGRVDDLAALEPISSVTKSAIVSDSAFDGLRSARRGERDKKFWPHVARQAQHARSLDELIEIAREMNELMAEPWSDTEANSQILKRCRYWWDKTQKGENRFGVGQYVRIDYSLVDELMMHDPDAYILLSFLRRHHWGRPFHLANEMHSAMPGGGWRRQRFTAARARLIQSGHVHVIEPASFKPNKPMLCSLDPTDRGVSRNGQ